MDEDSPLLTPEETGRPRNVSRKRSVAQEADHLLTPEEEQAVQRASSKGGAEARHTSAKRRNMCPSPPEEPGGDPPVPPATPVSPRNLPPWTPATPSVPSDAKYKRIKKVGSGAYGNVFMAENTETKEIVAIKVTGRKDDPVYGGFPVSVIREISILRKLKHENIVQLYELAQSPNGDVLMVMEYCQSSLLELLNSRRHSLSFSEVKYIVRQVLDATRHMHDKGILHRDLATKNVLFNTSGEIKVCDFGISRKAFAFDEEFGFCSATNLENPNMIVSLPYRSIELLLGQSNYGPALDVWSAGCIFGEILLCQGGLRRTFFGGQPDAPNKTPQALVEEIFLMLGRPTEESWPGLNKLALLKDYARTSSRMDKSIAHTTPNSNEERLFLRRFFSSGVGKCANTKYSLTESCFDLLGHLLTLNPEHRQTAKEALNHPFFLEKPLPEWHAWHWSLANKDIARGDQMRAQEKDEHDEAQGLLRKLTSDDLSAKQVDAKTGQIKSAKEQAKEALQRRAQERKEQEERKKAAAAAAQRAAEERARASTAAGNTLQRGSSRTGMPCAGAASDGDRMPPGWTKHWSSSKQRYYYHDGRSGKNQWDPPEVPKR